MKIIPKELSEFITVNFASVSDVIDQLGGVEIKIEEDELQYINGYIRSYYIAQRTIFYIL